MRGRVRFGSSLGNGQGCETCIGPKSMEIYFTNQGSVEVPEEVSQILLKPQVEQVLTEAFIYAHSVGQGSVGGVGPQPSAAFLASEGENLLENEEDELCATEAECFEDCPAQ